MKKIFFILISVFLISCSTFADTTVSAEGTVADFCANVKKIHFNEAQTDLIGVHNILFIGDSISYGAGASRMENSFAYIAGSFMMCFIPNSLFWNASVGGQTSVSGSTQFNTCPFIPDIIFVHFGMNDCISFSKEQYKNYMQEIISVSKQKNPNIKIILISTIIPSLNDWHNITRISRLPEYEEALYELKNENTNISVVPLMSFSAVMINNGAFPNTYTADSVHPTDTMHRLMAIECLKTVGFNYW